MGIETGWEARMLQEQQSSETHNFGLAREQAQQQLSKMDRRLAQRHTNMSLAAARCIAFVEQEVDHAGDRTSCHSHAAARIRRAPTGAKTRPRSRRRRLRAARPWTQGYAARRRHRKCANQGT